MTAWAIPVIAYIWTAEFFLTRMWGRGSLRRVLLWSLLWPVSVVTGYQHKRRWGRWPGPMRRRP